MKLVFSLVSAAVLLAGCGSPVKERTGSAAAGGTGGTVASCDRPGATQCRAGTLFRCEAGAWHSRFRSC